MAIIGTGGQVAPGVRVRVTKQASIGAALTSVGTPGTGTVDVTATPTQTAINNNFATVVARINAIQTALSSAGVTA